MSKKQVESKRKLFSIEEYMHDKNLNEAEFQVLAFNGNVKLFAAAKGLPVVLYYPNRTYRSGPQGGGSYHDPEMFIWANLYQQPSRVKRAFGLIGLSRAVVREILINESVDIEANNFKQDIYITKLTTLVDSENNFRLEKFRYIEGVLPQLPWMDKKTRKSSSATRKARESFIANNVNFFDDSIVRGIVAFFYQEFDFQKWRMDEVYRNENSSNLLDLFYEPNSEHRYLMDSLSEVQVRTPEIFGDNTTISQMLGMPREDYVPLIWVYSSIRPRIPTNGYIKRPNQGGNRLSHSDVEEVEVATKMPPPTISRSDLLVLDTDEDMYEVVDNDSMTEADYSYDRDVEPEQYFTIGEELIQRTKEEFWHTYDPEDKSTTPLKEEVIEWLTNKHGVSKKRADAIDSILRDGRSRPRH